MSGKTQSQPPPQFTSSDNSIDAAKRGLDVYRLVDSKMREAWRDDGQGNSNRLLKTPARANTVPTGPLTEIQSILASARLAGPKFIDRATAKVNPFISAADEYLNTIKTRTSSIPEKYGKFYSAADAAENRNKGPGFAPTEREINDMENVLIVRAFDLKNRLENWNPSSTPAPTPMMMSPYMVAPAFPPVAQNSPDLTAFQSAIRSLQSNATAVKVGAYASSEAEYRRYFSDVLETNKWNINNWQDFLSAVNLLQNDLRELVSKARDKYVRESEGRPDPITRTGATFAVYVGLSSNPTNLPIGLDANLLLSQEEVTAVQNDGILSIGSLQSAVMPALEEICAAARGDIRQWLDRPVDTQNATYKAQIQDLFNKLDQIVGEMQGSVLPSSPPPPSLQVTIQLLGSLKRELVDKDTKDSRDPTELASPDTAVQAASEGLPPVAGFLFRQISVERVAKYEDTIRKFKDVVDALPLMERVATQKKRLEEACDRFAKEFESVSAKSADGIAGKSAAEIAILVKKLNDAKVSAVTSFARGVRGNARNYLAVHEAFVTRQHGEGLRYMQYWNDIHLNDPERDPKKKLVNDKQVVDLLVSHSKLRQDLENQVIETMVKSPTAVLAEAEKARVIAMTKQPLLDEHHQIIVDKEFDRLREWIVAQTEQGQELYLRGSPTLLESMMDSTVIGVYILKAIRLGIAWVSLRVASRTFQAWYSRAVYEQNGTPPNPAFFVALFLGLDAALHAVVLTILYGIMMLYKSQENDFPIDSNLLSAWALDYAMATVVVGVISVILAMVVRSKKYFRYRYEGERGIRALQEMCLSTYAVILFLPFYRLAYT